MSAPFRTDAGGLIDRTRPLNFTFDGRRLQGEVLMTLVDGRVVFEAAADA